MGGMERCSASHDHHNSSPVSGNTNTLPKTKNFVPHKLFVEFETRTDEVMISNMITTNKHFLKLVCVNITPPIISNLHICYLSQNSCWKRRLGTRVD